MSNGGCHDKCLFSCATCVIGSFVFGPVVLGFFGIPGLLQVIREDKYGGVGQCRVDARSFWGLPFVQVQFYLLEDWKSPKNPDLWEKVDLVQSFQEAYKAKKTNSTPWNVSMNFFLKKLLPSLHPFSSFENSSASMEASFNCFYLRPKPFVVYLHRGPRSTNLVMFSVGLILTLIGIVPLVVMFGIVGHERLSVRRMIRRIHEKEKQVSDVMNVLGSSTASYEDKSQAIENLDLTAEYFHGKYHRATLFDIAAVSGDVPALEFLLSLPQVTVNGILQNSLSPKAQKCRTGRRPKRRYKTFSNEKKVVSNQWRSPLHHACIGHQLESVRFLVRHGADVNRQDHDGDTPLLAVLKEAVRTHHEYKNMRDILEVLVEAETDMSLCGRFTPIYSACTIGNKRLILYMAQCGSLSTKMENNFIKNTPLTVLIRQKNFTGVKILTQAGYNLRDDKLYRDRIDLNTKIGRYLDRASTTVPTLSRLCRNVIRQSLGTTKVQQRLATLPLPSRILSFLNLEDCLDFIPDTDVASTADDFVVVDVHPKGEDC